MLNHCLLVALADASGTVTAAWIAAGAAIFAAIAGGLASYWLHQSNERFIKEQTRKSQEHEKTHDTMLKRLDRFFEIRDAEVEHARAEVSSLAHYAPLLASSITAVKYRLHEIVESSGEIRYFHDDEPASEFIEYKRVSTLYRLAALFGWLRAFKLEQSLLNLIVVSDLRRKIEAVESAFSDGRFVDERRVELLINQQLDVSPSKLISSRKLSSLLQEFLARNPGIPRHRLDRLDAAEKEELCCRAVGIVNEHLNIGLSLPSEEERDRMLRRIGIREAWLYRDWQDALGSMMLAETEKGARRYNVIGYEEFETLYYQTLYATGACGGPSMSNATSREVTFRRWLPRLKRVFEQLNMSDGTDARVVQLKNASKAVEELASALDSIVDGFKKSLNGPI